MHKTIRVRDRQLRSSARPRKGAVRTALTLYFHLVRSKDVCLPDMDGVEVDDPAQAQSVALKTMRQLFRENPSVARDWSGWRLDGTDETGAVLFSIALDHVNRA
jgi:hypothetical protein